VLLIVGQQRLDILAQVGQQAARFQFWHQYVHYLGELVIPALQRRDRLLGLCQLVEAGLQRLDRLLSLDGVSPRTELA
jgi:hypothetical protein